MEFVGTDVNDDGNHPARSKFNLLWSWLNLKSAQDVASLFVLPFFTPSSFLTLNSVLVLATKQVARLQQDITSEFTADSPAYNKWEDIKNTNMSDPCLAKFKLKLQVYICTDFSSYGFGYATLQPDSNAALLNAIQWEMEGGNCKFMKRNIPNLLCALLLSDTAEAMAMKFLSIPTLARDLKVTGLSTKIGIIAEECNSHWLLISMQYNSFYHMVAIIL